jgi:hypothetical protein
LKATLNLYHFKKKENMKTLNFELTIEIFDAFQLSNEEMICVRGGEGDPIIKTTTPPVRI